MNDRFDRWRLFAVALAVFAGMGAREVPAEMVWVPAGPFVMGENTEADPDSMRRVHLPGFFMDAFEVNNGAYKAWNASHEYPRGADQHPAAGMTWSEARGYCEAAGKRLPAEAEWEKAARGPDGRIYPWGDKRPRKKPHPYFSGLVKRRVGYQKKDVSYYGAFGMAGSVWEWTADWDGEKIVTRGGLWNWRLDYEFSKTFERNPVRPDRRFPFLGFRCARTEP